VHFFDNCGVLEHCDNYFCKIASVYKLSNEAKIVKISNEAKIVEIVVSIACRFQDWGCV